MPLPALVAQIGDKSAGLAPATGGDNNNSYRWLYPGEILIIAPDQYTGWVLRSAISFWIGVKHRVFIA